MPAGFGSITNVLCPNQNITPIDMIETIPALYIHHNILILRPVTKTANTSKYPLVVVEIDYMVQKYQENRNPTQIIYPVLSHFEISSITCSIAL